MSKKNKFLNVANLLSVGRIFLSIPLAFSINKITKESPSEDIYFFLFICSLIAVSDILDGFFARAFNTVTDIGRILDPIADKICLFVLIFSLSFNSDYGYYYFSLFCLLIVRDLLITTISIYFIKSRNKFFSSNTFGKWFLFCAAMSMLLSIISIPNVVTYKILSGLNSSLYMMSWIFFILSTYDYFSGYIKYNRS